MKMDAEFLKKNLFWVLLVVAAPLILIALLILNTSVPGAISADEKKVTDELASLKTAMSNVKNEGEVTTAKTRAEELKKQETEVWKKAYETQKGLMTWPEKFEEFYNFKDGFFTREIAAERKAAAPAGENPPAGEKTTKEEKQPEQTPPTGTEGTDQTKPKTSLTYDGVIESVYADWIMVKGLQQPMRKTETGKYTLDTGEGAKKIGFQDLKIGDKVKIVYEVGKYYGDELTINEIREFTITYKDQIHPLLKKVQPINTKGEGIVQLGDWLYNENTFPKARDQFLTYFAGEQWIPNPHLSKEIWIAQEDLWIQNELYQLVAKANDYVATFVKEKEGDPSKKYYVYTNSYWRLDLQLDKAKRQMNLKMTNLQPRTQAANVTFKIKVSQDEEIPPFEFAVQGGSLAWNSSLVRTKSVPSHAEDIFEVKQVLTWETAAVKRIQKISIGSGKRPSGDSSDSGGNMGPGLPGGSPGMPKGSGTGGSPGMDGSTAGVGTAQSHRTILKELKQFFQVKFEEEGEAGPGEQPTMGSPMPGMPTGPMGGGTTKAASSISKNGFDFKRYTEKTPQSRRIPVAVVLIIEQSHLSKVQTAFSNSNLRFLTTQVLLNRYSKNISPLIPSGNSPKGGMYSFPGYGGMYSPPGIGPGIGSGIGSSGGYSPPPPMGGMPGEGDSGYPSSGFQVADSASSNMEMVIYGGISIYERFPARDEAATDATKSE